MKLISAHVSVMSFIHSILHLANKLNYTSVIIKFDGDDLQKKHFKLN